MIVRRLQGKDNRTAEREVGRKIFCWPPCARTSMELGSPTVAAFMRPTLSLKAFKTVLCLGIDFGVTYC